MDCKVCRELDECADSVPLGDTPINSFIRLIVAPPPKFHRIHWRLRWLFRYGNSPSTIQTTRVIQSTRITRELGGQFDELLVNFSDLPPTIRVISCPFLGLETYSKIAHLATITAITLTTHHQNRFSEPAFPGGPLRICSNVNVLQSFFNRESELPYWNSDPTSFWLASLGRDS